MVERKYKIKSRKAYEREINEESRNVVNNTLLVGAFALGSVLAYSAIGIESFDWAQKMGFTILGTVNIRNIAVSSQALASSIKRKSKLEDNYYMHYGKDNEERGRSR